MADVDVIESSNSSSYVATSVQGPKPNSSQSPPVTDSAKVPVPSTRKIIYRAHVDVVVESFRDVSTGLMQLCELHGGFIANANVSGQTGTPRRGSWTLRIPSSEYRAFLSSVSDVGEVTSSRETSQEVTAEFYDVQARIRNKQHEEKRLIELLENRTGKLPDILTVEKELSRVRGEIEQMQGRLRVLQDLTAYSTVTVNVQEIKDYVPPAAPSFLTEISREWEATLSNMLAFAQGCILLTIRFGPWVVVFSLMVLLAYLIYRRIHKKQAAAITA